MCDLWQFISMADLHTLSKQCWQNVWCTKKILFHWKPPCLQCNFLPCDEPCSQSLGADKWHQHASSCWYQQWVTLLLTLPLTISSEEFIHIWKQNEVMKRLGMLFQYLPLPSCCKVFHRSYQMAAHTTMQHKHWSTHNKMWPVMEKYSP
jgi:hypothetical protein